MAIILRAPDKKITLTKEEISYFIGYLDVCKTTGFRGINFFRSHPVREKLLSFSLTTFAEKVLTKYINSTHLPASKKLNIPVNSGEEISLITMFQRVDCGAYVLQLQQRILLTLRPVNSSTEIERK